MSPASLVVDSLRRHALWFLAAATLVHAAVREFEPTGGWVQAFVLGLLVGAIPPLLGRWRSRRGWQEAGVDGLLLAVLSVLLLFVLDAASGWFPVGNALHVHGWILLALAIVALARNGTHTRLRTLIGVEWMKLRKGRLLRVGLFVAGAATLLSAWSHTPVENESGWTQAARCMGVGFWTAEILLLVLGATAIAGEISQGTMKMVLPHAYRRTEWVTAKGVTLLFAAGLFVLVIAIVGLGVTALGPGLGDVTRVAPAGFGEDDEVQVFQTAAVMRGYLEDTALASGMSLLASACIGLLLSCAFGSLVPALSASFLVFAALKAGEMFLGLSSETLEHLYAHYPDELRQLTESFGRALNERWDPELVSRAVYLATMTACAGLVLSMRLFERRDLHG